MNDRLKRNDFNNFGRGLYDAGLRAGTQGLRKPKAPLWWSLSMIKAYDAGFRLGVSK